MGYYTDFTLKIQRDGIELSNNEIEELFFSKRKIKLDIVYFDNLMDFWEQLSSTFNCKWYEYSSDMKNISKLFPELLFILTGKGEEPGDNWAEYHQNGKFQHVKAEITFPPFDPSQMQ